MRNKEKIKRLEFEIQLVNKKLEVLRTLTMALAKRLTKEGMRISE